MLGLTRDQTLNAALPSLGRRPALRTYRHAPNTGSRKSWAAGDATSRAVRLALIAQTGEMGYPSVLTAKPGASTTSASAANAFKFQRPYGSYVMENVLFKISFPAEFHAQTAVEAAMTLHARTRRPQPHRRRHRATSPSAPTKPASASSTSKARSTTPPTATTASSTWSPSRSLFGRLTAADYEDAVALRSHPGPPHRRPPRHASPASKTRSSPATTTTPTSAPSPTPSCGQLNDGTILPEDTVEYPIGHRRRRNEGMPLLVDKFKTNLRRRFPQAQQDRILAVSLDPEKLDAMPVPDYVDLYIP